MKTRRDFNFGLASLAFGGLAAASCNYLRYIPDAVVRHPDYRRAQNRRFTGFGPLYPATGGKLLDLPAGLNYDVISEYQQPLGNSDGIVPNAADGMGAFDLGGNLVALVRNHELRAGEIADGAYPPPAQVPSNLPAYDWTADGRPLPGGTTTIVYDYHEHRRVDQYLSLAGTIRNCAGGTTPWGTWLTCEEDVTLGRGPKGIDHGWVFEVPAGHRGPVDPVPLKAMGRFYHEAAAVHPNEKVVYLTEDRHDGLFYRFIAEEARKLTSGKLQALALAGSFQGMDARNWSKRKIPIGLALPVTWIDLTGVESPGRDDLRKRGRLAGATRFANGEGIHFGRDELFFAVTSGGAIKSGQIFRYRPSPYEGDEALEKRYPGTLELFLESNDPATFNFGDNLTIAPNGHLVVCEDPYWGGEKSYLPREISKAAPCYLRGVTPDGAVYNIAQLHGRSELAGACFSPDGRTLFVNVMSPAQTLAIRAEKGGPFDRPRPGPWGEPLPGWKIPRASASV